MPKVIIDTNLFVSAFLKETAISRSLLNEWKKGSFVLIISEPILEEIVKVLSRPRIMNLTKISKGEIRELANLLIERAEIVKPKRKFYLARDPKDNMFLEAAFAGKADYLVTGDKDLLALKKFRKTKIINTRDFLNRLKKY
jgi:hypothetical protein